MNHAKRHQDWYAVVPRRLPETVLVVDRSLIRAWTYARMLFPDLGSEDLAFRTLPEAEFDSI
jgi:hypothetical protein